MARPNSAGIKKSPAQSKAAAKAFEKFRHEEEKPEPVLDPRGKVSLGQKNPKLSEKQPQQQQQLKLNFDTHCKIIISRKAAKILKSLSSNEEEEYDDDSSLQTWDDYIYQIADLVKELQKKLLQEQRSRQIDPRINLDADNDSSNDKDEIEIMVPIYSDTDIPLKVSQHTLELWKKLYKEVSTKEKDYVFSYSTLLNELMETYLQVKGLKVEGQDHFMRIVSDSNSPGVAPESKSSFKIGIKHKRPKVGSLFQELTDSPIKSG